MYQSTTCVVPSGFMFGITSRMTSSRMRRISSVSLDTIRQMNSGAACPCATSDECSPKSTQTTARPSRARARADDSGNIAAIPPTKGERGGDAAVVIEAREVAWRGDDGQAQRAALDRPADLDQRQAIRRGVERAQVASIAS